jgi:hypothetical protein
MATRDLTAFHPDRGGFVVTVCIGQPYCISEDESACPVALLGLHSKLRDQHGADSFQALMLAQKLAQMLLVSFVEDGGQLLDAPGGKTVDVESLARSFLNIFFFPYPAGSGIQVRPTQTLRVELPPRKYLRDICERHAAAKRDSRV